MTNPKSGNVVNFEGMAQRALDAVGDQADRLEREAAREKYLKACEQRREAIKTYRMPDEDRKMIISGTLKDVDENDPDPKTRRFLHLAAVKLWFNRPNPWLILGGSTGRGKTVAMYAAVADRGGVFIGATELVELFTMRITADVVARRKELFNTPLLCLDDIGAEKVSEHPVMCAALVELLNKRSSTRYRTIVSFNGDKNMIRQIYTDERLHSRLDQHSVWLVNNGPDRRRRRGTQTLEGA